MPHYKDTLHAPFIISKTICKLPDDLKVSITSPALSSSRHAGESSFGTIFGEDTRARWVGVASGCAWIWSEQSDGAGEASHASLGAQRERRERQGEDALWARGVQMVDNNSYVCSKFPALYLIY